jgi:hypothetical protein
MAIGNPLVEAMTALRTPKQRSRLLQKKANRIWETAAPLYGAAGAPAPKIWDAPSLGGQEAETVRRGEDAARRTGVKFSPKLASALLDKNNNLHNTALETLLHEWVHKFQPDTPVTPVNEWAKEGGAEAFAREHAPGVYRRAGIDYHTPRFSGYPEFTRQVRAERSPRWINRGQLAPIFGEESGANEPSALARNEKWAEPSSTGYQTPLTPLQEQHFRLWLENTGNPGEFDPNAKHSAYDMRGFWLSLVGKGKLGQGMSKTGHFPDAFKTPYDPSFSRWSKYAKPGTPLVWRKGNRLVNRNTGRVVFDELGRALGGGA